MTIDVSKLTMEERRDILWAILPKWVGPLELPGTGDGNKRLAVMPMVSNGYVQPNTETGISVANNTTFKPHRLIIQEVPYTVMHYESQPRKRWWHKKLPDKAVVEHCIMARHHWSIDSFFVGDQCAMLKLGVVTGDAFGSDKCLDLDWPTAQRGHVISFRVSHTGEAAVPFRALLLGTVMRHEAQMPFVPCDGGLAAVE